jgi:hypothetical protein
VLTSSKDWNVIVWDLERISDVDPPQRKRTVRFDAPVVSAAFHPKNWYVGGFFLLGLKVLMVCCCLVRYYLCC